MTELAANKSLIDELKAAADDESLPEHIRALLRRAAEESELDADYLALIRDINEADQKPFKVNDVVKDWLIGHGRLRHQQLEEDSETDGSA